MKGVLSDLVSQIRAPLRRCKVTSAPHRRVMERIQARQAVFIHVPKTGGKSISAELYGTELHEGFGHASAIFYRNLFGPYTYRKLFSFAFVRNPWDRVYSAYRFARAGGFGFPKAIALQKAIGDRDFNAFCKEWLAVEDFSSYAIFRPQHEFICDESDNVIVSRICRFEKFDDEYEYLRGRLGLGAAPERMNISQPGSGYRNVCDSDAREIISRIYARDISSFGYSFDS